MLDKMPETNQIIYINGLEPCIFKFLDEVEHLVTVERLDGSLDEGYLDTFTSHPYAMFGVEDIFTAGEFEYPAVAHISDHDMETYFAVDGPDIMEINLKKGSQNVEFARSLIPAGKLFSSDEKAKNFLKIINRLCTAI